MERKAVDVSLTPRQRKLVQEKVDSGVYRSPNEVVGEALRLLDERDRLEEIKTRGAAQGYSRRG